MRVKRAWLSVNRGQPAQLSLITRDWHWYLFYLVIIAGWCGIFGYILPINEWHHLGVYGWDLLFTICSANPSLLGYFPLLGMWGLMSLAMMLPTFAPTLQCYEELRLSGAGSQRGFVGLTVGYLAVWFGFSSLAAWLQSVSSQMTWIATLSDNFVPILWLLIGIYQFSTLKEACLSRCRQPFGIFLRYWNEGRFAEPIIGLRMGAFCLGCCWLLMSFAMVGGAMNLLWMGLATVVMTTEKLPLLGRYISKPLGVICLIAAAVMTVI